MTELNGSRHFRNTIYSLFPDVWHGLCQIRGGQQMKKKTSFLIWGSVRTNNIPPTKEFGKHCSKFHVYDMHFVSYVSVSVKNAVCKIQNYLTSEARIFCLPCRRLMICTKQGVRGAKDYVYGGPVRGQESLDLCQSLWRHAVTSVVKMREQLRD